MRDTPHPPPPSPFSLAGQTDPHSNRASPRGQLSSFITSKIHESKCIVVRRIFWYLPTWMLSNLFPWLQSLLCTFAVTGWQTVQLEITARTIRLWRASVALYLAVVVWRMVKKGEVETPIQFHTSAPSKLPAWHRTAAALLVLCCCCLLRLETVLRRGRGKLWSL